MTDEPTGSCPTCARRDPGEAQQICDVCRSKLRSWLTELPDLHAEILAQHATPADTRPYRMRVATERDDKGRPTAWSEPFDSPWPADPVANLLPAGPLGGGNTRGGPVSGSKEPRLPIRVDPVDLTGPARHVWLLGEDQIGYESVASTLDFWARDWREARGGRERLPEPTVPQLTTWLERRLDDAMDDHPAIDEFFTAIARTRGALRRHLGLIDIPDHKHGIPCPKCGALTLVHHNGSAFVECGSCPYKLTADEYDTHVRSTAAEQLILRRTAVNARRALRRLLAAMHTAGWRHHIHTEPAGRDADGAPEHDGYRVHTWRRGREHIELWTYADGGQVDTSAWYGHTDGDHEPSLALAISTNWIAEHGLHELHRLVRAAGLLTPPASHAERDRAA